MNLRSRVNVPVDVVRTDEDRYIVAFVPPERGLECNVHGKGRRLISRLIIEIIIIIIIKDFHIFSQSLPMIITR